MAQKANDDFKEKNETDSFGKLDFGEFLKNFVEICSNNPEVYDLVEGWDNTIQWEIEGWGDFHIKITNGTVSYQATKALDPDLIFEMDVSQVIDLFLGIIDVNKMYLEEKIIFTGDLQDAIKFRMLTEIVREELEGSHPEFF